MSFKIRLGLRVQTLSERSKNVVQSVSNTKFKPVIAQISPITPKEIQDDDAKFVDLQHKAQNRTCSYELILFWNPLWWKRHSTQYQRIGFKAPATITEAFAQAEKLTELLRQVANGREATDQPRFSKNNPPVEVCAVYQVGVFKDWEKEHKDQYRDPQEFVKQTIKELKEAKVNNKYVNKSGKSLIKANSNPVSTR